MAVVCPSCQTPARDDARFCASCGASLAAMCPSCGEAVDHGARFCSSCGEELRPPAIDAGTISEERRTVTALFADLVGYTAHTERTDPEDTRQRLSVYHRRVRQDVERFGGRVEKLMGDGVFAVFGTPVAHEDDPERAVRSALRIQDSLDELNATQPQLALAVRIGVATGEAVVQLQDSPDREGVVGDVVNTAARLQAIAASGDVVVDERTYQATQGAVEYVPLEAVVVKGKEGRLSVWRAAGVRSRYGVAIDEDPSTPFVGRNEELSLLIDAFDRAVARQRVQLVTVVGEPGVGKSRLIREFRRAIDDRPELIWWRQGRCLPYGEGITFWAIGEVIKAHAGILESEPPETAAAKLRGAVANVIEEPEEAEWITLRLAPLVGLDRGEVERSELFAAWLRFFEALAARSPLVLVIEDLHWADDAVIDFLAHLTDRARESPILILGSARPELFSERPEWGGGQRDAVTLGLSPLSNDETIRLVSALAERPLMEAGVQAALIERSGGNPLYLTEFVRLAGERGWLERLRQGEELPLPDSVASIIAGRLDLLPADDKALLQAAAVVGRVFWAGALSFVEGLDSADVDRRLRRLVARELIRPVRRSSMQGQEEYTFAHVLARDGAYGRLTREDRARLHEGIGRWLEAVSGERVADVAELLAHHYATALELRPGDHPSQRRQVYRFLMLAGDRARGLDAQRAGALYRKAIGLATTDAERARPLLECSHLDLGTNEERRKMVSDSMVEFATAGDREGEAEAAAALGTLEWYVGHAEEADRWSERALGLIQDLAPSQVVGRVLVAAAAGKQLRGKEDEALDLVERAITVSQAVGDSESFARALVIRGSSIIQLGDPGGLEDLREGLRIQLDRNDSTRAIGTYNNIATTQIAAGELLEGKRLIEEAITYGTQRGLPVRVDWSRSTRNEALFPLGEWDELVSVAKDLIRTDEKRGGSQVGLFSKAFSGIVGFLRGETSASLANLEEVLDSVRQVQDPQALIPVLAWLLMFTEMAGHAEEARALAIEYGGIGPEQPMFLAQSLDLVAQAMCRLDMTDQLELLVRRAKPVGEGPAAKVDFARAAIAEARGDHELAVTILTSVMDAADAMSDRWLGTWSRINAARNALALEDVELAGSLLADADAAARDIKAQRLLDQINDLRPGGAAAVSSG
ncbi:MAG TPA: AAA family ATPase [Acidimicrobiia bacterium]|nr:AAA family ATPase [Acidimicrobiia bacterium]